MSEKDYETKIVDFDSKDIDCDEETIEYDVSLSEEQTNILNFVLENYAVSPKSVARNFNISAASAANTLAFLIENKFIEKGDVIDL
jgi:predicted HTH transcriptional regulator